MLLTGWVDRSIIGFFSTRFASPDLRHLLLAPGVGSEHPVQGHVHGSVVTVEVLVVQLVEVVSAAWPLEPVMTQPSSHGTVNDDTWTISFNMITDYIIFTKRVNGMKTKDSRNERSRVVESCLHRMHVGPGECSGIVGLVMETVNLLVQELANVRNGCRLPWMHCTVHDIEMRNPEIRDMADT